MSEQNLKLPDLEDAVEKTAEALKETPLGGIPGLPIGNSISTKELVISIGVLLVAAIIFFIIKNYVSKILVANMRKSPRAADMAGWSLFSFMLLAAIAAVLTILDSTRFLSLPYLIPLGGAMVVSLVIFVVAFVSER